MKQRVLALGLAAMVVAACSGATPTATASPTPSPTTVPTPTATAAPTASPSPLPTATTPTPSPESQGIPVVLACAAGTTGIRLFFVPTMITVPAGDATFVLTNPSDCPHNMIIGPEAPTCTATACTFGPDIAVSATVPPRSGPTDFAVEDLASGTYSFWCSIQDHAVLGMIGKLTVEP